MIDFAGYHFIRGFAVAARALPAGAAYGLGSFLGDVAYIFSSRRKVAYADLKAAFGARKTAKARWQTVRAHYRHIGQSFIELLRFPLLDRQTVERDVSIPHLERFNQALNEKKGVVLLTAHLGNWELLQIVSGIFGSPIQALMRDQKYPRLNGLLNDFRRSRGSGVASRGMGIRDLMRSLRRRELVGVLGDQSAGRQQGLIVPFFGRKTTIPTGAFQLAGRAGALVLPAFIVRLKNEKHEIHLGKAFHCPEDTEGEETYREFAREYVAALEDLISRYPEQWLWAKKRWKYSWTKRILILSDGKPGHFKQSQAVAEAFRAVETQYGRPGMEYPTEAVTVKFRSPFHKAFFAAAGFFFFPWAQGRLSLLRFFFDEETSRLLEEVSADFIVSAGAGLVPLNLCLARENQAKSVVIMKPPFPYNFLRYDLAIVPAHDTGKVPAEAVRTLLTLSSAPSGGETGGELKSELRDPEKIRISLFLGGPTRDYRMEEAAVRKTLDALERSGADYLVTTSRRTPEKICAYLKQAALPHCQKIVIAAEDARPGWVGVMTEAAEVLVITEDSISMVSEAAATGKKVIMLSVDDAEKLPKKHRRFADMLAASGSVSRAAPDDLAARLESAKQGFATDLARNEKMLLQKRLQEIL
ncbi:MAG TPA: ELM1/GtrOC1 family putative glycosyltransferase [Verrucomicrobiae bacterium]|nr:ELM1/GtrOC1 family putative glycosyltransferase [Verrucomicrobiae bacterium]